MENEATPNTLPKLKYLADREVKIGGDTVRLTQREDNRHYVVHGREATTIWGRTDTELMIHLLEQLESCGRRASLLCQVLTEGEQNTLDDAELRELGLMLAHEASDVVANCKIYGELLSRGPISKQAKEEAAQ